MSLYIFEMIFSVHNFVFFINYKYIKSLLVFFFWKNKLACKKMLFCRILAQIVKNA